MGRQPPTPTARPRVVVRTRATDRASHVLGGYPAGRHGRPARLKFQGVGPTGSSFSREVENGLMQQAASLHGPNPTLTLVANSSRPPETADCRLAGDQACPDSGLSTDLVNSPPVSTLATP